MPTIIGLDVSLSMTRNIPLRNSDDNITYHQMAVAGINQFLDYLSINSKMEFVSLVIYSTMYEIIVDFTRDYDLIKRELKTIKHYDKTVIENFLQGIHNILATNWGTQSYCQVLVFTDCGIGLGKTSMKNFIKELLDKKSGGEYNCNWLPYLTPCKLNFICIGTNNDQYFVQATKLYQQLLDVSEQNGAIFFPINTKIEKKNDNQIEMLRILIKEMIDKVCETNYKPFEASLKCGSYFRLESSIFIWPPPRPYTITDNLGRKVVKIISRKLEVCGFLSLSDIGSPVSLSRHLIIPKTENNKINRKSEILQKTTSKSDVVHVNGVNELEKLESEIRSFYLKQEGSTSDDESKTNVQNDTNKESVCVLLHGALKVENMAALILLNDDWYAFINSYADSKKKSNLMLNILQPGNDVIPWLGDLRLLGHVDDALPGENPCFPIKAEKRSYSQNCVVWIKQSSLQSDIQKVLRHAKKLPDKTPHFYKELNRIRRAALSLGFIELLNGLANVFDREIQILPQNASPDCAIQMKHAANELRKIANNNIKTVISAQPTKYNQL